MKASDLDKVTTLLQDLAMARITLRDFEAIPDNADPFLVQTGWPGPTRTEYFSLRLDPKLGEPNLIESILDQFRELLSMRIERLEDALRELGVDPSA
jgi:hypothetical protein